MENAPLSVFDVGAVEVVSSHDLQLSVGDWVWIGPESPGRPDEWRLGEETGWLGYVEHIGSNYWLISSPPGVYWSIDYKSKYASTSAVSGRYRFGSGDVHLLRKEDVAAWFARETMKLRLMLAEQVEHLRSLSGASAGHNASTELAVASAAKDAKAELLRLRELQAVKLPQMKGDIETLVKKTAIYAAAPLQVEMECAQQAADVAKLLGGQIQTMFVYAGLDEDVVSVRSGEPAVEEEPVHLMQYMCYMDEESLLHVGSGLGLSHAVSFKCVEEFDAWLAQPGNFERVLPFPKTVVAFRPRRDQVNVHPRSWEEAIRLSELMRKDRRTFLYVRNGERLSRVSAELDLPEVLFPDDGFVGVERICIPTSLYDDVVKREQIRPLRRIEAERARWSELLVAAFAALNRMEDAFGLKCVECRQLLLTCPSNGPVDDTWFGMLHSLTATLDDQEPNAGEKWAAKRDWRNSIGSLHHNWKQEVGRGWEEVTPDSLYYDDVCLLQAEDMRKTNMVVVLLQGLLDRGDVLRPHRAPRLWMHEEFAANVKLVRESLGLYSGDPIDITALIDAGRKLIKPGTVCYGLHTSGAADYQIQKMKESQKDWWSLNPDGGQTSFKFTRPVSCKRTGELVFEIIWYDHWYGERKPKKRLLEVPRKEVFNVEAYEPGTWQRLFADRRTRAQYLKWAPFMIAAERWHAEQKKNA